MLRNIIWLIVSAGIFSSFLQFDSWNEKIFIFLIRGTSHTVGVGLGNYFSLLCEPHIEKVILKLKNRGKRKKRWYIKKERNL
jgi:hypothetical protein